MARILIIDDEQSIRSTMKDILEFEKYVVETAQDAPHALESIKTQHFDVIFSDIKMPQMNGIELLEHLQTENIDTPIIMISGHGNIDVAVECIKKGAYDYLEKPIDLNRLLLTCRNALEQNTLKTETKILKKTISKNYQLIGKSAKIQQLRSIIERVAPTDARVLITGANGTGKEVVAHLLFELSNRANKPFIEVNCAAIPNELIESELFGHEKGAFTSAVKSHIGKFEQANGGTIFLDEVGDMSLAAQAKVLRCLQENVISPVGSNKNISINVRVLAATNKNLQKEIDAGNFREDLYHRLNVIPIRVPTLDERKEDIPMLMEYFAQIVTQEIHIKPKQFAPDAVQALQKCTWHGNVRQLHNVIERLLILGTDVIDAAQVEQYAQI